MERDELNAAFERFLNTGACRDLERELHDLVRAAFVSGWCAARTPDIPAGELHQLR